MRFFTDACGRTVTDHGLGVATPQQAWQGCPPGMIFYNGRCVSFTPPPPTACPPPGFPGHTQENGDYCCIPAGCAPARPGTLAAIDREAKACIDAGGSVAGVKNPKTGVWTKSCYSRSGNRVRTWEWSD